MYYSHPCPYCRKVFFTYNDSKEQASRILYTGIKKHLVDYNEDHKEHEFDEAPEIEVDQVYYALSESNDPPTAGYELK